jgi:CheY-like chemotaxis protein
MSIKTAAIIDDDQIFVFGTKKLMTSINFCEEIQIYNNGLEALTAFKNGDKIPEVIFLDLNMPVMDGWQFLEEFQHLPVNGKPTIYIVSSSVDPADITRAQEYEEVTSYVIKPITRPRLKEILESISE